MSGRMADTSRRLLVAGVALAVLVGGGFYMVQRRGASVSTRIGAAAQLANGDMAGMAGMSMSSDGSVRLTANQIRQFGVTFGTAEVRPLTAETRTTGFVTVDETRLAQVTPRFGGYVERLYVETTGQPVRRGQALAAIYSPVLVAAQQDLLVARGLDRSIGQSVVPGVPATSMDLLTAAKRRLQLWDISDAQIQHVLTTGQVQRTLTLYSPASGVVTTKNVVQGQSIQAGQELYEIADLSTVWVDVQLREADAGAVRTGSAADIMVDGLPGRTLRGRVAYVYPTLDSAARAVRARVVVPNPNGVLKPGMYATVRLSTPARSALTVPSSAVLRTGERNIVFVDIGGGKLMPRDVEVGRTAADYTEILSGVESGQRVVTSAQFLLDSESNLGEVMKSMIGMNAGSGTSGQGMQDMPGMPSGTAGAAAMSDKGADVRGVRGNSPGNTPSKSMQSMPGMQMPAAPATTPRR